MGVQVLKGTWEEISEYAAELAGKQMRLTVLSEAQEETAPDTSAQTRALLQRIMARQAGVREPAAFQMAAPPKRL